MSESSSTVSNGVALRALAKKVLSDELLTWQYDESASTEKSQSVLKRVLADAKALVGYGFCSCDAASESHSSTLFVKRSPTNRQ